MFFPLNSVLDIQVCPVKPIPSPRPEFEDRAVPVEIRHFYNSNEVDTFQLDRPYHRGEKDKDNESKVGGECLCVTFVHHSQR